VIDINVVRSGHGGRLTGKKVALDMCDQKLYWMHTTEVTRVLCFSPAASGIRLFGSYPLASV